MYELTGRVTSSGVESAWWSSGAKRRVLPAPSPVGPQWATIMLRIWLPRLTRLTRPMTTIIATTPAFIVGEACTRERVRAGAVWVCGRARGDV